MLLSPLHYRKDIGQAEKPVMILSQAGAVTMSVITKTFLTHMKDSRMWALGSSCLGLNPNSDSQLSHPLIVSYYAIQ